MAAGNQQRPGTSNKMLVVLVLVLVLLRRRLLLWQAVRAQAPHLHAAHGAMAYSGVASNMYFCSISAAEAPVVPELEVS